MLGISSKYNLLVKSIRDYKNVNFISFVCLLGLTVTTIYYFILVINYCDNIPKASDDLNYFLTKYYYSFEIEPSFQKIFYNLFFSPDPHQKLDVKLLSIICNGVLGNINFYAILLLGHVFYLSGIIYLRKIYHNIPWALFFASCLFYLNISWSTAQWSVAVWGYQSFIIYILLLSLSIYREKTISAILINIFCLFTLGSGFTVSIIGVSYFTLRYIKEKNRNDLKKTSIWISLLAIGFIFTMLRYHPDEANDEITLNSITSIINYTVIFLYKSILPELLTTYHIVICYLISISLLLYSIINFKKLNDKFYLAVGIVIVLIANALISGISRNYIGETIPLVPTRYEIYSLFFISILILLIGSVNLFNRHRIVRIIFHFSIVLISLVLYFTDVTNDRSHLSNNQNLIKQKLKNALALNPIPKTYKLDQYIEDNIYKIPNNKTLESLDPILDSVSSSQLKINNLVSTDHQLVSFTEGQYAIQAIGFINNFTEVGEKLHLYLILEDSITNQEYYFEPKYYEIHKTPNFRYFKKDFDIDRKNSFGYEFFILKSKLPNTFTLSQKKLSVIVESNVIKTYELNSTSF